MAVRDIQWMQQAFGQTARTFRFWEGLGLLSPTRVGLRRDYPPIEQEKARLILAGKAMGLDLATIRDGLRAGPNGEPTLTVSARALAEAEARLVEQQSSAALGLEHVRGFAARPRGPDGEVVLTLIDAPGPKAVA